MTKATKRDVRKWILTLTARQAVHCSVDELEVQVGLAIPALIARYSAETFCQASIDAVAAAERFWSEAGTVKALDAWCQANQPKTFSALPEQAENAPLARIHKLWLAHFYRAGDDVAAASALDLIRAQDTIAFEYLCRTDDNAISIAIRRGWMPRTRDGLAADWDDEEGIRRLVRKIAREAPSRGWGTPKVTREGASQFNFRGMLLETLARMVGMHARQHGPAMFDELNSMLRPQEPAHPPPLPADPFEIEGMSET